MNFFLSFAGSAYELESVEIEGCGSQPPCQITLGDQVAVSVHFVAGKCLCKTKILFYVKIIFSLFPASLILLLCVKHPHLSLQLQGQLFFYFIYEIKKIQV